MLGRLKSYIIEVRPFFLTASFIPVILGSIIAWSVTGEFNWFYFILTLIAGLMIHASINIFNDYFDHKSGTDDVNFEFVRPYGGGSRMIQLRLMSPREVLLESIVAFAAAIVVGAALLFIVGVPALYFGLVGILSAVFYTIWLVRVGMGEVFVGLNFGVLMTVGAYYVQTGTIFSAEVIVASIPIALLIALVLFINQFQNYEADKATGKRHLVVRLGRARSARLFVIMLVATYLSLAVGVAAFGVSPFTLLALLTIPLAWKAAA